MTPSLTHPFTFGDDVDVAAPPPERPPWVREHPAPWWFHLLSRWFPDRCREIPEAVNPDRIVLRQFAIVKRYCYLQQFASSEDARFMHSHQWRRVFALGLWGSYTEQRHNIKRLVVAPYFYTMGRDVVHHVQDPSPGHTSIFFGVFRDDDLKQYFETGRGIPWEQHIQKMVKRI
jgi:hypothetical protein